MSTPTLFDYLPREAAEMLCKLAEGKEPPSAMKSMARAAAGMGVGTLAGIGLAHGIDKTYQHFAGRRIPAEYLFAAAPVIGGGLGLAYNLAQAHQLEEMKRALEATHDGPAGRVP
jgi:hypothetical protein